MNTRARFCVICALLTAPTGAQAQVRAQTENYAPTPDDVAAVEHAAFDYIDAIYRADVSRIERSVHPSLTKVGYYRDQQGAWRESPMDYARLLEVARTWNRDGQTLLADAPREVVIYEVLNRTANAKVIAQWGVDYLHLVKYDDGWKIRHILWQEPAPANAGR